MSTDTINSLLEKLQEKLNQIDSELTYEFLDSSRERFKTGFKYKCQMQTKNRNGRGLSMHTKTGETEEEAKRECVNDAIRFADALLKHDAFKKHKD